MYELTELFLYKFVFILEILVSMHLFSFRRRKKKHFAFRVIASTVGCLGMGFLYPIATYSPLYSSAMFLTLFAICVVSMLFIYDMPAKEIVFLSVLAYTTQHFAHEVYTLLANSVGFVIDSTMGMYGDSTVDLTNVSRESMIVMLVYLDIYLVSYWLIYKVFARKINQHDIRISNLSMAGVTALILLVEILLNSFTIYVPDGFSPNYTIILALYNMICCILILYLQVNLCIKNNMENELEITSMLLYQAKQQYKQTEENIKLMNLKCHDLKHQIKNYAEEKKISNEYIKEIQSIVNIYDSPVKTGNETLDLILTEKNLWCQMNGITLNCFADCSKLEFMNVTDLYSFFGNIMENAIDAVLRIEKNDKRVINMVVKNVGNFVSIQVENYYEGEIIFGKNGLPVTTKDDNNYHGYGMESIRMIVAKYDGDINLKVENSTFHISVIFPLQK